MKRKNLKVGLRVEMKVELDWADLQAGAVGVVQEIEPDDYAGDLACSVLFEGCVSPLWVEVSQIRIADKVRKMKSPGPGPTPDAKMPWPWPAGTLVRLNESAFVKRYYEVCVLGSDGSDQPPVLTVDGRHLCFVIEANVALAEDSAGPA